MKSKTVLFIGCGDLGMRAGAQLSKSGYALAGVRRRAEKLPEGYQGYSADYTTPGSLGCIAELRPEFIVTTFNPFDRSEQGYRRGFEQAMKNVLDSLADHHPEHILMASSTRVYAEAEGGWVEENGALSQTDPWAAAIIAAENALLAAPTNASVVRFSGIYGIPGGRLVSRIQRGEIAPQSPQRFTNRIHREDAAGFLAHLVRKADSGEVLRQIYIGTDNCPAPRHEVESWLAQKLGVTAMPPADAHDPTRHNNGHKRCRNRALLDSGYSLLYPDYRSGYQALLADN